ncbi:alpha/beta fold hydrolase [Nocardiopsis aegyptia]|uniref:Pimeloyl-ACP methyl ester carboxylesterase n=1 Tax=Nocardiopsis aegyptia TaxID=220378 RepID=A0A7Z0JCH4_9ACTN|nr:alpha/beta fold hydrolase [Nocardiopsis aegyptia]NYJ37443.1 pimeloyl-ACP methyl ester carboxylesterase [Nocardiopsis aegyptia]
MGHTEIGGLRVAFDRTGDGPSLVLLHGILQDARAWRPQLEGLRDRFGILAWDAPGCGRSEDPPEHWRLPEYADCLAALLSELGVTDPVLCGLSWGGTLALEFQHRHPGRSTALVLVGAYAGWAGSLSDRECRARLASCLAQAGLRPEEFVPDWMPGLLTPRAPSGVVDEVTGIMSDFHPSGFRTMARAVAAADLRPHLARIDVPALVVHGDDDRRAPAGTVGAALAGAIPGARLVVLPESGHLCNVEQPGAFDRAVRDFAETVD